MLPADDDRPVWLDDPGFLASDRSQGSAKETFVIEVNVSDYCEPRIHHVGSIEASSQSDFEDARIRGRSREADA